MSVQMNTYCLVAALLPYAPFRDDGWHKKLEPYMDNAFKGIHHHDGLCVLFDGMNAKYVVIGHVIAKTPNFGGFDEPIKLPAYALPDLESMRSKIQALIPPGLDFEIGRYVISHYR